VIVLCVVQVRWTGCRDSKRECNICGAVSSNVEEYWRHRHLAFRREGYPEIAPSERPISTTVAEALNETGAVAPARHEKRLILTGSAARERKERSKGSAKPREPKEPRVLLHRVEEKGHAAGVMRRSESPTAVAVSASGIGPGKGSPSANSHTVAVKRVDAAVLSTPSGKSSASEETSQVSPELPL
jgi:hypothetical protein